MSTDLSTAAPAAGDPDFSVPVEPIDLPLPDLVVVLAGGLSHEREVSLRSGRRVAQALRSRGIDVLETDVDSSLVPRLAEAPDAVVFPVLHGEAGEDGALREVLALLGVPFVGSVGSACRVAFDKSIATTVVADAGVTTPTQVALHVLTRAPFPTIPVVGCRTAEQVVSSFRSLSLDLAEADVAAFLPAEPDRG